MSQKHLGSLPSLTNKNYSWLIIEETHKLWVSSRSHDK